MKRILTAILVLVLSISVFAQKGNRNDRVNPGFNNNIGLFGLAELDGSINWTLGATGVVGYRLLPQFAIGIGAGMGYINQYTMLNIYGEEFKFKDGLTIPIYLYLRSDFLNRPVSPYVALAWGYQFDVINGCNWSYMNPTVGVSFNVGKKRMNIGAGPQLMANMWTCNFKVGIEL
jgi:hypothetical protein